MGHRGWFGRWGVQVAGLRPTIVRWLGPTIAMMHRESDTLLEAIGELIRPHLERSEPLRRIARELAVLLLEEARSADPSPPPPESASEPTHKSSAGPPTQVDPAHIAAELPLHIAGTSAQVIVRDTVEAIAQASADLPETTAPAPAQTPSDTHNVRESTIDLDLIIRRCRIKAESCRLYIQRRDAIGDDDREPVLIGKMNELIERARSMDDCFLWMFWRERSQPADGTLEMIADCYDATAAAAEVLSTIDELGGDARPDDLLEAFQLAAEANSALRIALTDTWLTSPDKDQDELHLFLKDQTTERSIFVPRYMRLDDPADPHAVGSLLERIASLREAVTSHVQRTKSITNEFGRIRYHAHQLEPDAEGSVESHNCRKIHEAIMTLDELGIPFSDPRFAGVLPLEVLDLLGFEEPPPAVQRVIDAVRARHESGQGQAEADEASWDTSSTWSECVLRARELLEGGVIVVVGGEPRNEAMERITSAFGLADIVWVPLQEHGPSQPMRSPIQRPETRLVLVLVKLAGHLHVKQAQEYARNADKPVVLLPAGYNPEQIADAISQQASETLAAAHCAPAGVK